MLPKIRLKIGGASFTSPAVAVPIPDATSPEMSDGEKAKAAKRKRLSLPDPRKRKLISGQETPRPAPVLKKKSLYTVLNKLIAIIKAKDTWGFFIEPVDTSAVPDYLTVIKYPMDLGNRD